ncbi:MAG: class I SAM-dependent methyltransferase [Actinomycetota bacterium]|nr:class I SAM-dependent methyltransferase [Actinomycetota bacterium]
MSVVDPGMRAYYEARAAEYDDWFSGTGAFATRTRPGWRGDVRGLVAALAALPPARTLDVACGTAFLGRHLPGEITAIDQSPGMVAIAAARMPEAEVHEGEAVPLPFADGAFQRVTTGHFYGHLRAGEREAFLAEARRVAGELVVIDSALRDDVAPEEDQERRLSDGTRHVVYKRFFTPEGLARELGGGETVFAGAYFVAVRCRFGPSAFV